MNTFNALTKKRLVKNAHRNLSHHLTSRNAWNQQHRQISLLHKTVITSPATKQLQTDLDTAISLVRQYDPSGYLPGLLIPKNARVGYFAIRSFWVETGLRLLVSSGGGQGSPEEKIQWWRDAIASLFTASGDANSVVRLLRHTLESKDLSEKYFDRILTSREKDLHIKQYSTVDDLVQHSQLSCASLLHLVMECANISEEKNPAAYTAAQHIGTTHGLTNALRGSIPIASITGRIIIPQELCTKHGVKSPRYLLNALGMGDEKCRVALQSAVKDLTLEARQNLDVARSYREEILREDDGDASVSVLLPGLASETFLNRLEQEGYDLTSRDLRKVSKMEHAKCASHMMYSWMRKSY